MVSKVKEIANIEKALRKKENYHYLGLTQKQVSAFLENTGWKPAVSILLKEEKYRAAEVLHTLRPAMDKLCEEPECGWLEFIKNETIAYMFPANFKSTITLEQQKAVRFFLIIYRGILKAEMHKNGFSPADHLVLCSENEVEDCVTAAEYERFRRFWEDHYIYEFMRIYREVTPYNTVGHISGVHHVATFVGRQLVGSEIPIDIGLVSSAAACHDLGKFGCKKSELSRIPHLHYYYTNEVCMQENLPMTAHIGSNHSTWDLELENLSVESLLLIYADFRVKSKIVDGKEVIFFYTLDEAFDVILNKLENVDEAKRQRYEKVYDKLKDFENYLIYKGVQTDVFAEAPEELISVDPGNTTTLMGMDIVEQIKHLAIQHNIRIMSTFNNEATFASLLESARTDNNWKSQRTYLNILSEYFTYMTKQEKLLSLRFAFDLLSSREGDIRRQASSLMGLLLANFQDQFKKELPEDVEYDDVDEGLQVWTNYLHRIMYPDTRVTDQHRSWIGFSLRRIIDSFLHNVDNEEKAAPYIRAYFDLFKADDLDGDSTFILIAAVLFIPEVFFDEKSLSAVLNKAVTASVYYSNHVAIAALQVADYISGMDISIDAKDKLSRIVKNTAELDDHPSVRFYRRKVKRNLGTAYSGMDDLEIVRNMDVTERQLSDIFRENLKVGTHWILKALNMEFLKNYSTIRNSSSQDFYLATHFSNLLKVSERVVVRHLAGMNLLKVSQGLPIEQINELVVELTNGLEIGDYQFSKYIPGYLGRLALYLYPSELDELIITLDELIENANDKVASVALDTIGELFSDYYNYKYRETEGTREYRARLPKMLGILLKGVANYRETVSQEAVTVIGQYLFDNKNIGFDQKFIAFKYIYKKLFTLLAELDDRDMAFYTNAATLNHMYRFISDYIFKYKEMELPINRKIAFFPGTFDPFSLSHKGIVESIRKEGFEVYLALDEFSWSKKTQARKLRRNIITMSVANMPDVFLFPDDFPVNIANPDDIVKLKELFPNGEVYMVAGSDVIINASSYKAEARPNSIHYLNHIIFRRENEGDADNDKKIFEAYGKIIGKIKELKLPVYMEDISSTKIRDNIDNGRDISNLIDPVAQNYIYDNSLYLREPQYKKILDTEHITVEPRLDRNSSILRGMKVKALSNKALREELKRYIERDDVRTAVIRDERGKVAALAATHDVDAGQLFDEFNDIEITSHLRNETTGRILIIRGLYANETKDLRELIQILTTELLSDAIADGITHAVFHPLANIPGRRVSEVLRREGFTEIVINGEPQGIFEVSMRQPIVLIEDMDTVLKAPFNTDPEILKVLKNTRAAFQEAVVKLAPGNLLLSFNAGILNRKIVDMVTAINEVPNYPLKVRQLGECMCVPFGKILRETVVPNTVTKALHTEKVFTSDLEKFDIMEYPMYSSIVNQVKTIKSFNRPVILVDDILHKGYRMRSLDPVFKENDLEIKQVVMGIVSGRGKDLLQEQGRDVVSAYFIPNLKYWFVESAMFPFIGGDGIESITKKMEANLIPSINLIEPFASPSFLKGASKESVYDMSYVCMDSAERIFSVLEKQYQTLFERQLTIRRLSDVIKRPRMPNGGTRTFIAMNLAPSAYILDYKQRLERLERSLK